MVGSLRTSAVVIAAMLLVSLLAVVDDASPAGAQGASDFNDELVAGGMSQILSLDWMPDGRALVVGKWGEVHVVTPSTGGKYRLFQAEGIDSAGERGLLDVAVDPNFSANKYFYLYYSDSSSRLTIARYRFTGNGVTDKASRTIIWQNPGPLHSSFGQYHIGGSLNFGNDARMYLTIGDGFSPANSANLTNVFGKVLRINADGSVPGDNPFNDGTGPNIDEIWAYGLRNPFRASFDAPTGRFFIGDVGGNDAPTAYEEVNLGAAGKNYGWPACEGPLDGPKSGPTCPSGVTAPIITYDHDPGGSCCQNAAITGGEIFRSGALPASLNGAYIYGDYAERELRFATFNSNGSVAQDGQLKAVPNYQPVWIGQGPDGHIYYVHFAYSGANGELRRLRYTGGADTPPVITQASATPTSGAAPLDVVFTGAGSDADGDPVSYVWSFGDGTTSTNRNASHTYSSAGTYTATLRATAGGETTSSSPITIAVGQAPTVAITSPSHQSSFVAGETIELTGTATDNGPLSNSSYRWDVSLVHDNHIHPTLSAISGPNRSFTVPRSGHDFAGDTSYLVTLTVTDSDGIQTVETVEIEPVKRSITVANQQAAVSTVKVDGITRNSPFVLDTIEGFAHGIEAVASTCVNNVNYVFSAWNIGGSRARTYTVPATDRSISASFTTGDCTPPPTGPDEVKPAAAWTGSFFGTSWGNPTTTPSPIQLTGTATDNQALRRIDIYLRDRTTLQFWNQEAQAWQTTPKWHVIDVPNNAATFDWVSNFTPTGGSGKYVSGAVARDLKGNWFSTPGTHYDIGTIVPPTTTPTTVPSTTTSTTSTTTTTTSTTVPATSTTSTTSTTMTTAPPAPTGPDSVRPTGTWTGSFFGTSWGNPTTTPSPIQLTGTATDNQALRRVEVYLRDRSTGRFWNQEMQGWQTSAKWHYIDVPNNATTFDWVTSFTPTGGSGEYVSGAVVRDVKGNWFSTPATHYDIGATVPPPPTVLPSTTVSPTTAPPTTVTSTTVTPTTVTPTTVTPTTVTPTTVPNTTTTTPPAPTGPDSVKPSGAWTGLFFGTSWGNPTTTPLPVRLTGTATDNQALRRVEVYLRDRSTGRFWNQDTRGWQTSAKWHYLDVPNSAATFDWTTTFAPAGGSGRYVSGVVVRDVKGNWFSTPATHYNIG